MNNINFGDIYWVPSRLSKFPTGYWCVVLCVNINEKKIIWQKLSSQIYKIFPNFGSFTNDACLCCSKHNKIDIFRKYLLGVSNYIDIDTVVFLNFYKYNFLKKETFFSVNLCIDDNLFDFSERVRLCDYKFAGNLLENNERSVVIASRASKKIDPVTLNQIMQSYKVKHGL